MASCSYCDSTILFGGKTDQTGRYCSLKCQQMGNLLSLSSRISPEELDRLTQKYHLSNCPKCGGPGPVDVHKSHQVWSIMVMTSYSTKPQLSCKFCATKKQLTAILFSGVCGWWGVPWGVLMTPIQIGRNITEMISGPETRRSLTAPAKARPASGSGATRQKCARRTDLGCVIPGAGGDERAISQSTPLRV